MGFSEPIGRFYVTVGIDTSELRKEIDRTTKAMRKALGKEAIGLSEDLAKAVAASAAGFVALGVAAMKMAADLEKVTVGFATLVRSASVAKEVVNSLREFSTSHPFEFEELASASKKLLMFGVSAKDLMPTLTNLGNISAGVGQPIEELAALYGKVRFQGSVGIKDLKALTGSFTPIVQQLADQFGVASSAIKGMVKDGKIHFSDLQQAVLNLTTGSGKFANAMQAQSQTVNGALANLKKTVTEIMVDIGIELSKTFDGSGMAQSLSKSLQKLKEEYVKNGISAIIGEDLSAMRFAVVALAGAITGTLIPALNLMALRVVVAFGGLVTLSLYAATGAWALLLAYAFKKLYDGISENFDKLKLMALSTLNDMVAAVQESVAKVILAIQKIAEAMPYAPGVDTISKDYVELVKAAHASREAAHQARVEYNNLSCSFQFAGRSMALLISNSGSLESILSGVVSRVMQLVPWIGELAKQFGLLTNSWLNSPAPAPSVPDPSGDKGKRGKDLAREAKSISDSIKSEWMQTTKDEEYLLNEWYDKQLEQLNKSKAASKTYHDDLIRLKETYLAKVRDLSEKEYDKQMEDLSLAKQKQADKEKKALDNATRNEEIQNQLAEELNARIEAIKSGQKIEQQLWKDYRTGDMQAYLQHVNQQNVAFMQSLRGRQEAISLHQKLLEDAHRSSLSYMVEGYQTLYTGLTDALVGVITGSKSAAQAMKELGMQLITMVVKWMVQRQLAATMSKGLEKAMTASSVASAAITAKAWAPAAAMVAAATFGASTATAAAGLTALSGLSRALAITGLAKGGIVTSPTLAMIGEGKGPEAVIPLDRLGNMGGETRVTVNVHNNTGTPTQARQQTTRNGQEVVVDLFLDAFARDVNGLRTVLKGA